MPFSSLSNFQSFLTRTGLMEPAQLQECVARIQASGPSIDALLREIEQRHYLTPYQVSKLRKRESDGLRLGPYKLLYRNASGSFARVFRAVSVLDGQMVGVKVLRQRWAEDPRTVSLFRREGELGKRLKHKNIVPIYEVGSDSGQHYIAMEFIEGGNFRELLKSRHKFSVAEASRYALDIAEGLDYALSLGLTHRDLKLTNVLLSAQGVAKLVDFGLAGQDASLSSMEEEVDRAVEYATLEKSTNAPNNDPRSDLYFLGAMFYELLTGVAPYPPSKSREDRKQPSRYRNIKPIRQVNPSVPPAVMAIVDQLMQINPHDRYQTPGEVIRDLQTIVQARSEPAVAKAQRSEFSGDDPSTSMPSPLEAPASDTELPVATAKGTQPVVLCVEGRAQQQDSLREYFTKHGYRVLILRDVQRAMTRVAADPPDGLILMADALGEGDEAAHAYEKIGAACRKTQTPIVFVLSKKNRSLHERFADTSLTRILSDKHVTLRTIRQSLEELRAGGAAS
jgi:eukaryotic-like serine/threonine-protein kinase